MADGNRSNADLAAGHRAARDELQKQLERWEVLFAAGETAAG